MRKIICIIICLIVAAVVLTLIVGEKTDMKNYVELLINGELTVGKDIGIDDITEFYYTYYNINYNAKYQRYHFYVDNGKYMFYHEKREKQDYGPLTEDDITQSGTVELSNNDWSELFGYLKDGKVKKRQNSAETGDSGSWYYLYWNGDRSKYQEFAFVSVEKEKAFEDFCMSLIQQSR